MPIELRHFVGLDLGQAQEPTALAVLQRPLVYPGTAPGQRRPVYGLPWLRRFPPGTAYAEVIAQVVALLRMPPLPGAVLMVDATGVGKALVDMLMDGLHGRATCTCHPVTITAGHAPTIGEGGGLQVPKKELVGVLQVLVQTRRLQVARTLPDAALLLQELENFRVKAVALANEAPALWREGPQDDLVLAVALAAWMGEQALPPLDEPPEEPTITRLVPV
jgi:hypothetical protein